MDHIPCAEAVPSGEDCVARGAAAQTAALGEQTRTGGTMDRPIHPTASQKRLVRRVHDDVDIQCGDVALDDLDSICPDNRHLTLVTAAERPLAVDRPIHDGDECTKASAATGASGSQSSLFC